MDIVLPLDQMTTDEKLSVMERLWEDLCRTAGGFPSPAWHEDALIERERRVEQGDERFTEWDEAKANIRKQTR